MLSPETLKWLEKDIFKADVLNFGKEFIQSGDTLKEIIGLTFNPDKTTAFHAAWLLDHIMDEAAEKFIDDIPTIITRLPDVENPSCKRHYARIMRRLTDKKAPKGIKDLLMKTDLEPVVEKLFDWLIDPKVLIAVKAFAAETLFNLRERYPWLKDELPEQLKFLMRDGSAGIQSKGRHLLAAL